MLMLAHNFSLTANNFFNYLVSLMTLNFGKSIFHGVDVLPLVWSKIKITLLYLILAFILTYMISLLFAVTKQFFKKIKFFYFFEKGILLAQFIPIYVLAVYCLIFFSGREFLNIFPLGGINSEFYEDLSFFGKILDSLTYLFLPVSIYCITILAEVYFLLIGAMAEQEKREHVRFAKAKGLSQFSIIVAHVLNNSLGVISSSFSSVWVTLVSTSILVERVFSVNGFGNLLFNSMLAKDFPVLLCCSFFIAISVFIFRTLSDCLNAIFDPRARGIFSGYIEQSSYKEVVK